MFLGDSGSGVWQQQPPSRSSAARFQRGGDGLQQVPWLIGFSMLYFSLVKTLVCAGWKRVRSSGLAHFRLFRFGLLGCCSVAAGGITTATRKVIKLQRARFPDMKWIRADLRRMPRFKDKSFDIVIEKALTLVTIHHGNDFW